MLKTKHHKINLNSRAVARIQIAQLFINGVISKAQANKLLKLIDQKFKIQQALQKEFDMILAHLFKKTKV